MLNSQTIWNEAQNKPTLVVRDIMKRYPEVDPDFIYEVLLRRGVFKWLAVRRELIHLKYLWKEKVRELNRKKTQQEKGFLKALEECRKQVRILCHSSRWKAPDIDKTALEWLDNYARKEIEQRKETSHGNN